MIAIGLPVALAAGAVGAVAAGLFRRLSGEGPWWRPVVGPWRDLRRMWARREAASGVEVGGAVAALLGAGLASASALGLASGSAPLVFLSLLLAAAGGQVAASDPPTRAAGPRVAAGRAMAVAAEPAVVIGLGAAFLRWRAVDLEAVAGAQSVLGPGIVVGRPLAVAGLVLAAVALAVAGALRLAPRGEPRRGPGRPAGSSLVVTLCRWSLAGATSLVVAALVAGPAPGAGGLTLDLIAFAGAAVITVAVLAAADSVVRLLPDGVPRRAAGATALVLAMAGVVLVVVA